MSTQEEISSHHNDWKFMGDFFKKYDGIVNAVNYALADSNGKDKIDISTLFKEFAIAYNSQFKTEAKLLPFKEFEQKYCNIMPHAKADNKLRYEGYKIAFQNKK